MFLGAGMDIDHRSTAIDELERSWRNGALLWLSAVSKSLDAELRKVGQSKATTFSKLKS
jgi:hypothetical protein